jgi:hypothetical protein
MLRTEISSPREVQAFAASSQRGEEIWLANLTGESKRVALHTALTAGRVSYLDAGNFVALADFDDALDKLAKPYSGGDVELDAYAVARLQLD